MRVPSRCRRSSLRRGRARRTVHSFRTMTLSMIAGLILCVALSSLPSGACAVSNPAELASGAASLTPLTPSLSPAFADDTVGGIPSETCEHFASLSQRDSDSDGMSDQQEGDVDTDSDSIPDFQDHDSDNDGVPDAVERALGIGDGDSDSDSIPNEKDADTVDLDGDGFDTEYADTDGDGILSPAELDAKSDYQHLLCLDTNEDDVVTKRELQDAFSEYRRSQLWNFAPTDVMNWVRTSPTLHALKPYEARFEGIGGPLLFDYVVMKPYKVRTKLKLGEDATDELRLAVCDVIASERDARLKREAAEATQSSQRDDNVSYTGSYAVDWLLNKVDNMPWWAQGTILTLGVLVFSTLFYQLERNSAGAKERHLRQAAEKYQKRRAKKDAQKQRRLDRQVAAARRQRELEAQEEERNTRRLRDTSRAIGQKPPRLLLPTVDELRQMPADATSLASALEASSSASGTPTSQDRIQARSKCGDETSSSAILDHVRCWSKCVCVLVFLRPAPVFAANAGARVEAIKARCIHSVFSFS